MPLDHPQIAEAARVVQPIVEGAPKRREKLVAAAAEWRWANGEWFRYLPYGAQRHGGPTLRWQKRPGRDSVLHALDSDGEPTLARRYRNGFDRADVFELFCVKQPKHIVEITLEASVEPGPLEPGDAAQRGAQRLATIHGIRPTVYGLDPQGRVIWTVYLSAGKAEKGDGPSIERTTYGQSGLAATSVYEALAGVNKMHIRRTYTYHHDDAGKLTAFDSEYVFVDSGQVAERKTKKIK